MAAIGPLDFNAHTAPILGRTDKQYLRMRPCRRVLAIDAEHAFAGGESGLRSDAFGAADNRQIVRLADHEHRPQQDEAEQEIEHRAGDHDRHPLQHRLAVEGLVQIALGHFELALVEHLHVAAERNCGNRVFGAIAAQTRPQRLAEAHRKADHVHAKPARDPEMAELMEGDQDADADDQPPDRAQEIAHADRLMPYSSHCY